MRGGRHCLIGNGLSRPGNIIGLSEVVVSDRLQILVKFIYQRNAGRDIQADNLTVRHIVQMLYQRAHAIAVGDHDNTLSRAHSRSIPLSQ